MHLNAWEYFRNWWIALGINVSLFEYYWSGLLYPETTLEPLECIKCETIRWFLQNSNVITCNKCEGINWFWKAIDWFLLGEDRFLFLEKEGIDWFWEAIDWFWDLRHSVWKKLIGFKTWSIGFKASAFYIKINRLVLKPDWLILGFEYSM